MAILVGLLAALVWAVANLAESRASRAMPPASLLAGISLVGLAICAPLLIAEGAPRDTSAGGLCWLALGGAANIAGLLLMYIAFRVGDVGLVAPITASEGAVAAVIAIGAGERVRVSVLVLLAVIVLGVMRAADANTAKSAIAGQFNWGVATVDASPRSASASACTPWDAPRLTSSSDGSLRLPVSSACSVSRCRWHCVAGSGSRGPERQRCCWPRAARLVASASTHMRPTVRSWSRRSSDRWSLRSRSWGLRSFSASG